LQYGKELGIFSHVSDILQATKSWAGPEYETKYFLKCMHFSQNRILETIASVCADYVNHIELTIASCTDYFQ